MPIKKAAKKYMRVTSRKTSLNNSYKKSLREKVRVVEDSLKTSKPDEAAKAFVAAQQAIDKAAKKGVIKKNTAARKKSRLAKKIKALTK